MRKLTNLIIVVLLFASVFSLTGCNQSTEKDETGKVVIEYDGGKIYEGQLNKYIGVREYFNPNIKNIIDQQPEAKKTLSEQLVAEKYVLQLTKEQKAYDDNVNKIIMSYQREWKKSLGSDTSYKKMLDDLGITEADLSEYLNRFFNIEDYFVNKKYDEDKEFFTIATVSHILVEINENRTQDEAKNRAEEVLSKLKAGEDFGELAKNYSDDKGSSENGGTYENQPVLLWVPEFKEAALTLPLNEVSGLVKTKYGYHIMKVTERKIPALDEITDEQKDNVYTTEFNDFLNNKVSQIIKKENL